MQADIIANNPELGTVEIDLVRFGHGRWSYKIVAVNGRTVEEPCSGTLMTKAEATKQARNLAKNATYTQGIGYHG